jgi:hypothetical protein
VLKKRAAVFVVSIGAIAGLVLCALWAVLRTFVEGKQTRQGGTSEPPASSVAAVSQIGDEPERATITMTLGERRQKLTGAEARHLHNQLVEHNLAVLALQSELRRAIGANSEQHEIPVDEQMRQELLLSLDEIDDPFRLSEGLRHLRQAARPPITPRPEY